MKLLAIILIIWLICLMVGAFFGILGKLIWIAILATAIGGIWKWLEHQKNKLP